MSFYYTYAMLSWPGTNYLVLRQKKKVDNGNLDYGRLRMKEDDKKKKVRFSKMDKKDIRIIGPLISGFDNRHISSELDIPLSTVQRRTRVILQSGLLQHNYKPNYRRLGLKKEWFMYIWIMAIWSLLRKKSLLWRELHLCRFI